MFEAWLDLEGLLTLAFLKKMLFESWCLDDD